MTEKICYQIIVFLSLSLLSSLSCKNSALFYIEEIGINKHHYPKHYVPPTKWMRRVFKVRQTQIPRFLYAELCLAAIFAVMGPVNIIISIVVRGFSNRDYIIGVLVMLHVCLILCEVIFLAVFVLLYRAKRSND